MSIEKCNRCDAMVDTDFYCEIYRDEFNGEPICDKCYDRIIDEELADEGCVISINTGDK